MLAVGRFFANAAARQGCGMLYEFVGRRQSQRRVADIFSTLDWDESFDYKAERSSAARSCGTTKVKNLSGLLSPYRVVDLSDERSLLAGQMLGRLGADVVQVEPLGGDTARACAPFDPALPDGDNSFYWSAWAGFGNLGAAIAGYQGIVGWPDTLLIGPFGPFGPIGAFGPFGPYTDFVAPRFGLV